MNVGEHVITGAKLFPARAAIVFADQQLTYEELDALSRRAAGALDQCGVGRGDRVAILLPNCPAFVVWYLATLRKGAVAVSISTRLK